MASLAVEPPANPDEGPRVRCRLDIVQPSRIVTDAAGADGVGRRTTPTSPSWTASTGYNAPGALLRVLPGRCSAGTTVIRVLVAEDDEFQRMAIASRFRAANDANVAQGSTVQFEALLVPSSVSLRAQVSADANFQLVLLDVCLGVGETSDALIGEIRRALGASVPIVMFSAVAHQDLVERCLSLGADTYLAKPLHVDSVRHLWTICFQKNARYFKPKSGDSARSKQAKKEAWKEVEAMKKEGKAGVEQKGPKAQAERRAAADAADHDHYHSPSAHSTAHLAHRTSPLGVARPGPLARARRRRREVRRPAGEGGGRGGGMPARPTRPAAPAGRAPTPAPSPPRSDDYRTASRDDNLSELDNMRLDEPADGFTADQIENLEDVGASCKQQ